mmetsp:Transcript_140636/g.437399  ORF Transcript_140636/g.437399 Transcript_140636/m.437399 type:complete len:396 (-) Transcript_140636:216-1403(-)
MPAVAASLRFLSRYGDLFGLVAALPLISHVKFGSIIEAQEAKKAQKARGGGEEPAAPSAAPAWAPGARGQEPGYLPPAWALFLVLLAEVLSAWSLFDPSDKKVRRAVGETLRIQKRSKGGALSEVLASMERLLGDEDVYYLIRSVSAICSCASVLLAALAGLDRLPGLGSKSAVGPARAAHHGATHLLRVVLRPRLLGLAVLLACLAIGHHSALLRAARRPGVAELLLAAPALLRAMGLTGVAFSPSSEVLPIYAALHSCAALARQAHVLVYERIALSDLLKDGLFEVKAGHMVPRSVIAMDLWSMLVLLPTAFSKRRFMMILPFLALPCLWLASDGPIPSLIEPHVELIIGRIVFCTAVVSFIVVFMGGLPTMTILILLAQALMKIHKLDKLKY